MSQDGGKAWTEHYQWNTSNLMHVESQHKDSSVTEDLQRHDFLISNTGAKTPMSCSCTKDYFAPIK